jgi:hypothetical protein
VRTLAFFLACLTLFSLACAAADNDADEVTDDDNDDNNDNDNDNDTSPGPDDDDDDDNNDDDDNDDNDDDNDDDNNNDDNDDTSPLAPVYGYYQEGDPPSWTALIDALPVFAEYGLTLFLGMPDTAIGDAGLADFLRQADAAGVEVRAWVLLPYAIGYWPGEDNAAAFAEAALAYAEWFLAEDLPVEWIVVDMEMDINKIAAIEQLIDEGRYWEAAALLLQNLDPEHFAAAVQVYQQMVSDLTDRGLYTMVVTYPHILDDLSDEDTTLQDIMDVPVTPVNWDEVSTMVYSSTYEQYLGVDFGAYFVYDYALSTVAEYGDRASIALGVSGEMTDPAVLAAEVAAAKAAGIYYIQVYSYAGSAGQPDPDAWHAAFAAEPVVPPNDIYTRLLREALTFADWLF